MNPDGQFSWSLAQSGRVFVSHEKLPGTVKSQVHIQCDCLSDSLLSDIISADRQGDIRPSVASWLDKQLGRGVTRTGGPAKASPAGQPSPGVAGHGKKPGETKEKTHVARLNAAEHKNEELLVTDGEFNLQGEKVIVRDGVPFFQSKSQVQAHPSKGQPAVSGSKVNKKRLEALSTRGGKSNLQISKSELLDGNQSIIQDPWIRFGRDVLPVESIARKKSLAQRISADELSKILPNHEKLAAIDSERSRVAEPVPEANKNAGELNKVVLVNCRCVLKGNSLVALRGLLHVGDAWHRIVNGTLVNSLFTDQPVIITGRPVYQDGVASEQMLLNKVTLHSVGNTVYADNSPLLEDAMLHADGKVMNISDLPSGSLCGFPPPKNPEPARLFVSCGRFSVRDTGLTIHEGTVWLQDVRMQLPEDTSEEVHVTDSMVFLGPASVGQDANAHKEDETRDLIYRDNILLLDDLTPLLKGGVVCHDEQEQPLAWLSGDPEAMDRARKSQPLLVPPEELTDRVEMLSDATCILDRNDMYFINGSMILQGKPVLLERGIPFFSSETAAEIMQMNLGTPPPRLSGRVLLDLDAARELGATIPDGFAVLKNANLDMTDGKIILNNQVPVMSDCKMVMDRHILSPTELGFAAGTRRAAVKASNVSAPREAAGAPKKTAAKPRKGGAANVTADAEQGAGAEDAEQEAGANDAAAAAGRVKATGARKAAVATKPDNTGKAGSAVRDYGAAKTDSATKAGGAEKPGPAKGADEAGVVSATTTDAMQDEDADDPGTNETAAHREPPVTGPSASNGAERRKDGQAGSADNGSSKKRTTQRSSGQPKAASDVPAKGVVSLAGTSTADQEDSGRGASDWAESSQRAATALGEIGPARVMKSEEKPADDTNETNVDDADASGIGRDQPSREVSAEGPNAKTTVRSQKVPQAESDPLAGQKLSGKSREQPNRSTAASDGSLEKDPREESGHDSGGASTEESDDANRKAQEDKRSDSAFDPSRGSTGTSKGKSAPTIRAPEANFGKGWDGPIAETDGGKAQDSHEPEVLAYPPDARPLGDILSNGILGSFSVTSDRVDKKLVFSLKARIDEMLHFLDSQT